MSISRMVRRRRQRNGILFDPKGREFNHGRMDHSPGFLALVNEAKKHVNEISVAEARARLAANPRAVLMDVREDNEWTAGHAAEAVHLGKGILERDLEKAYPDKNAEIIMYCGGGFRSALTCEAAQKMGYKNVFSLIGGYKGLVAANWPMKTGS
ncbi:MAG TPA: rhodanese-like domain-containing protein [Verrucomicrobiae bacterium]|nr:rhodanese-like domain-containing protein [Verrucomicrobiae bacterium]